MTPLEAANPRTGDSQLRTASDVLRALEHFDDVIEPRSASLLSVGSGSRPHREIYGNGFLHRVEEHDELVRRMRRLPPRERLLLVLWYSHGWPVVDIAARLQISRVHCYRLRNQALATLIRPLDPNP
jgi:DNA-directed RNA polymerase specialized sigma24 family protein